VVVRVVISVALLSGTNVAAINGQCVVVRLAPKLAAPTAAGTGVIGVTFSDGPE